MTSRIIKKAKAIYFEILDKLYNIKYLSISMLDWRIFSRKKIEDFITRSLGECKIKPYKIKQWHNGTSYYVLTDKQQNNYFMKKSIFPELIDAEKSTIEYLNTFNTDLFSTCKQFGTYSNRNCHFIIETFVSDYISLDNSKFWDQLDQVEKLQLAENLYRIIERFAMNSFVHSDFTPKNILYRDGDILLIDFEYSVIAGKKNNRFKYKSNYRKLKLNNLGGNFSMRVGVYDDAYSLAYILKKYYPQIRNDNPKLWESINMMIGHNQVCLYEDVR